jgi:hypothetical protein
MSTSLARIAVAAGVALGALALTDSGASAMPVLDQAVVGTAVTGQGIEKAYWHRWHHRYHGTTIIVGTAVGDHRGPLFNCPALQPGFFQAGTHTQPQIRLHT